MLWAAPDLISIVIVLIVISMLRVVSQFIQLSNSVKKRKTRAILVQTVQLDWLGIWLLDFALLCLILILICFLAVVREPISVYA